MEIAPKVSYNETNLHLAPQSYAMYVLVIRRGYLD